MIKKLDDRIEIYEDLANYTMYYIVGIITVIAGLISVIQLLIKGNTEYIGTYIVCAIIAVIMIGIIFFVRYCNKKRKSNPYLEMIITEDYVEFYSLKEEGKSIKSINIKEIKKVFTHDNCLIVHSIDENGDKQIYSYSFGHESSNLYIAKSELKKLVKK